MFCCIFAFSLSVPSLTTSLGLNAQYTLPVQGRFPVCLSFTSDFICHPLVRVQMGSRLQLYPGPSHCKRKESLNTSFTQNMPSLHQRRGGSGSPPSTENEKRICRETFGGRLRGREGAAIRFPAQRAIRPSR